MAQKNSKTKQARSVARVPRGQKAVNSQVTISECDGVRNLHFGTVWIQGAMRLARPFALELEYQQQMMAPLLLLPQPRRIVQLGLGAAALTKFCWRFVESAEITVVDISDEVIAAAQRWFKLPPNDARLQVLQGDALEFVQHRRRAGIADWLQVDLYDADAAGPVYDDLAFYSACRRLLAKPGVAAFNLFGRSFRPSFGAISEAFDGRTLLLPEAEAGNRVVLGLSGPVLDVTHAQLSEAARVVQSRYGLPARRWVAALMNSGQANCGPGAGAVPERLTV